MTETAICIRNGHVVLPSRVMENAHVVIRGDRIRYVGRATSSIPKSARIIDARGGWIVPGYIDLHVHGGAGADFMDGDADAIKTVCQAHARHGTTTIFPTTTTGTEQQIAAMLDACRSVQKSWTIADGAAIAGVHLYGPYFAPEKAGCHDPHECRSPESAELRRYFKSGMIAIATCAAELPGAEKFYRMADKEGCLITCGHSGASWNEMQRAFDLGMRHVDHFWCAMSNVSSVRSRLGVPMQGSMLEFVLANEAMSTEVIADGMHLAPELLEFAWRMKGSQRLCLVTDCNRALDMPPGSYHFGARDGNAIFHSDGQVGWAGDGNLASSVRGMDHMVREMARHTSAPLHEVIRMATLTPAERAGIADQTGSLEKGKEANVLVLSKQLKVRQSFIRGHVFSSRRRPVESVA